MTAEGAHTDHDLVLVVDFGAQYAQLIARRVREARVYSEIVPHTMPVAEMLARNPKAIVLSGGPSSVYEEGAPTIDSGLFTAGTPVFGMCYGFQLMAQGLGGEVAHTGVREYGRTPVAIEEPGTLLADVPVQPQRLDVARRLGGAGAGGVHRAGLDGRYAGGGLRGRRARAGGRPVAPGGTAHRARPEGARALPARHRRLPARPGRCSTSSRSRSRRSASRSATGRAICALSGGVDSAVAAAIVQRAIGERLTCVYVDHGMMRLGETEQVRSDFEAVFDKLDVVEASEQFVGALEGIVDPEEKRKIIGREFIRTFEAAEVRVFGDTAEVGDTAYLVQGTLYPDVVESGGGAGTSNIKSHHNVGGLPDDLQFELVEPLRTLFKDEVRLVGEQLGLPSTMVWRQPFPGPGLGIRIIGEVTRERLDILRQADAIAREELTRAGLDRDIWQMPVVLLADVRSVGVQGDGRTYGHPVVIRPVTSEDAMTADWARLPYDVLERISTRITNEVSEINRVTLDVTSKPPGTIEWE